MSTIYGNTVGSNMDPAKICKCSAINTTRVSNAVAGSKTGEIVKLDDISPFSHEMEIVLDSKNLNIPIEHTTTLANGYSISPNADGSTTVSGAASTTANINVAVALRKKDGTNTSIALAAGQKYRMHFYKDGEISTAARLKVYYADGNTKYISVTAFNTDEDVSQAREIQNIYIESSGHLIGDTALCGVYTVIVQKDLSKASLIKAGKNLIPYPFSASTKNENGITFTDLGNGTVKVNGTASADAKMYLYSSYSPMHLRPGRYMLSGCPEGGSSTSYSLTAGTSTSTVGKDTGAGAQVLISDDLAASGIGLTLIINAGTTVNNLIFKPQIEAGSIASAFEQYITTETYASDAFGAVPTVVSMYPTTTLLTDTTGVSVSVKYNKNVNAALEQIAKRPIVTFIDDDCQQEQLDNWEEIDRLTGVKPTIAVVTGRPLAAYDSTSRQTYWPNIKRLTSRGFEFVSHTNSHQNLTEIDAATAEAELSASMESLQNNGINPKFLVYPYNEFNDEIIEIARKYFVGAVTCNYKTNTLPVTDFAIERQSFTATSLFDKTFDDGTTRTVYAFRTDEELQNIIDEAVEKNGWVVIMTHLRNYDVYYYDETVKEKLINLIDYAKSKGCQFASLSEGYKIFKGRE